MFIAPDSRHLGRQTQRGLTLLEVVVGLAILSLMAGAIYAIVMGSVEATATLRNIQTEDRRLEALLERTRLAFAHLPAGATLELRRLENEPPRQELILRGVPGAFIWGDRPRWDTGLVTIAPQPWPEELLTARRASRFDPRGRDATAAAAPRPFTLSISAPEFFRTDADGEPTPDSPLQSRQGHQFLRPDIQGRFWFDLLPEVDRVEWKFYDPARKIWVDQHPAGRPPMIELQLTLPGRTTPVRTVFPTA
jgi:prepilin-type N-terminal cleavage/methylation domain-containing protein